MDRIPESPVSPLPISARTALVDTQWVRAARGVDADRVSAWVDDGRLLWVFDISVGDGAGPARKTRIRELRFWVAEVVNPGPVRNLELDEVLDRILPRSRTSFGGTEICQRFLISRPHALQIGRQAGGAVNNHTLRIPRSPLAEWMKRRWVGAGAGKPEFRSQMPQDDFGGVHARVLNSGAGCKTLNGSKTRFRR